MKKIVFLLLVLFSNLSAQYYYKVYDQSDGVVYTARSFYQESDSVYWLGNEGSLQKLTKFNGDSVVAIFTSPIVLGSTNMFDIAQDTSGSLWITLGSGKGMLKFTESDTSWEYFVTGLISGTIKTKIDSQNHVWVTHSSNGVSEFDGNSWVNYNYFNSVLTENAITEIEQDDKSRLYFAPIGWISRKEGNFWTNIYHASTCNGFSDFSNYTKSLFITPNENDVLVGTVFNGVVAMDSSGNCLYNLPYDSVNVKHQFISDIIKDQKGNIWISYDFGYQGVSKFDGTNWEYLALPYYIEKIEEDKYDYKIWLTTFGPNLISVYPDSLVGVSENQNSPQVPKDFFLSQNFPNPFNPSTTINYELQITTYKNATLTIYNVLGKEVKQWKLNSNFGEVVWNGTDNFDNPVSSGVYLYQLKVGKQQETKKMVLLK